MDVYKTWAGLHGPGPWTWTTPNLQKEIAPVNMKIFPEVREWKTQTRIYSSIYLDYKFMQLYTVENDKRGGGGGRDVLIELQFQTVGMKILGVEMH